MGSLTQIHAAGTAAVEGQRRGMKWICGPSCVGCIDSALNRQLMDLTCSDPHVSTQAYTGAAAV